MGARPTLNILMLHGMDTFVNARRSTVKHLCSLERYAPWNRVVYHYIDDPVTDALKAIPFDVIIMDATFLCWRWVQPHSAFQEIKEKYLWIRDHAAIKLAFPQDDYDHAGVLDDWLADYNVDVVYTICPNKWEDLYPRMLVQSKVVLALTGYIDEDDIKFYGECQKPFAERDIDIGYRVRKLPAYFGRFGRLKSDLGQRFKEEAAADASLIVDISDSPEHMLLGDAWPKFLGSCRFALGCESGSGVLDTRGQVRRQVDAYCQEHPEASFDEIEKACLSDGSVSKTFSMISPRIFEMVMAGCCPILIEGDYNGLLQAETHYIPVKPDLSNIKQVLQRAHQLDSAAEIASRAREALLSVVPLRYSAWVDGLDTKMRELLDGRPVGALTEHAYAKLLDQHRLAVIDSNREKYRRDLAATYNELERVRQAAEQQPEAKQTCRIKILFRRRSRSEIATLMGRLWNKINGSS